MDKLIYNIDLGNKDSKKIAGFDLDSTLIKTKSGRVHPKDKDDWQFFESCVRDRLMKLQHVDGYNIVIFTNQSGLDGKEQKKIDFLFKLNSIISTLGVNVSYFVSTGYSQFRKPMVGCITLLELHMGNIDRDESFYCGDACGRPAKWKWSGGIKEKKDFSSSDLLFAHNCNLKFYTPEEYFHPDGFTCDDVKLPDRPFLNYEREDEFKLDLDSNKKYVIVMIGLPASGKSHLAKQIKKDYDKFDFNIVNQDTLGTKSKNNKLFKKLVEDGENIIVDNTNLVPKDRKFYIDCARDDTNYNIIGIRITTDWNIIVQLNHVRCFNTGKFIKSVVYNTMKKRMDIKGLSEEGFDNINEYSCKPMFDNEDERSIFMMYY